ncbi:MAG TPA: hypothetical protein VKY32_07905 [Flavobacterium sp.]|nr:hypothetical protein [Flavobacterium sp.]
MNYTDIIIAIIDRTQIIYEWFVKIFGYIADWFDRFKDFILDLVETIKDKFFTKEDLDAYLKNYLETEHNFI